MTIAQDLVAATAVAATASAKLNTFINGDNATTIDTSQGALPTLSKFLADQTTYVQAQMGAVVDEALVQAGLDDRMTNLESANTDTQAALAAHAETDAALLQSIENIQTSPPSSMVLAILAAVYPVGTPYFNKTDDRNPSVILGFGTWSRESGRVLVGYQSGDSDFGTAGATGGAKTHTLTGDQIPAHHHRQWVDGYDYAGGSEGKAFAGNNSFDYSAGGWSHVTEDTGGGQAHNNLQPYVVYHWWVRTA